LIDSNYRQEFFIYPINKEYSLMLQKIYWLDHNQNKKIIRKMEFRTIFCNHEFPFSSIFYNRAFMMFDGGIVSTAHAWTLAINNCSILREGGARSDTGEVAEQIRRLLILQMNFFFGKSPNEVEQHCNTQYYIGSEVVAKNILPDFFSEQQPDLSEKIRNFSLWVPKVLSLDREIYKAFSIALAAYEKALQVLSSDPTLSYSLLVFVIESLANSDSSNQPTWKDLPAQEQNKFDEIFKNSDCPSIDIEKIKTLLLKVLHPGATKRFAKFAIDHIPSNFYDSQNTTSIQPIRYSKNRLNIENAYNLRSSFAHALKPLTQYLISESTSSEEVEENGTTYLTLRGLFRLVRAVLLEFVEKQEPKTLIMYNWDNEFNSNAIKCLMPAHYEMKKPNGELRDIHPEHAKKDGYVKKLFEDILVIYQDNYVELLHKKPENSFGGIVTSGLMAGRVMFKFDPSPSYTWRTWQDQSLDIIPNAKQEHKGYLQAIIMLCSHLEEADSGKSRMNDVISHRKFGERFSCLENFVTDTICNITERWTGEKAEKLLENHFKNRKIRLPNRVEMACILEVASLFQNEGKLESRKKWLEYAYGDSAQYPDFQSLIKNALTSDDIQVKAREILDVPQEPSFENSLVDEDYW
jgi:hypothetical protein